MADPVVEEVVAPKPRRPVVMLDPGHGGDDPDAATYGIVERDSNIDLAFRIEAILLANDIDVLLTRRDENRAAPAFSRSLSTIR